MGANSRVVDLRMALHSASTDFTTMPGSLKFVEPSSGVTYIGSYNAIERDLERSDAMPYSKLQGTKNTGLRNLSIPLKGINGGAGDGTSTSASTKMDIAYDLLTAFTGRAVDDATGDTTTSSGTGTTINATSHGFSVGESVLVAGADSGKLQARFITGDATDDFTVCRSLTQDDGTAEGTDSGVVIYAGAVWQFHHTNEQHIHLAADIETSEGRRQLLGMLGNPSIQFPSGGVAALSVDLDGTDWAASEKANPSFSAPTAGSHIKVINSPLYLGSNLYMASELSFEFGLEIQERASDGAPNGRFGYCVVNKAPVLRARVHYGALTSPNEVTDAFLQALQGETNQDVLLQVGRAAGACMAIRLPDADIRVGDPERTNGQWTLSLEMRGTRPAGGAAAGELGAAQIAIF
jgi:hypothetical protein